MSFSITLSQSKSKDSVSIVKPSVLGMPYSVSRYKAGEMQQDHYHRYFWEKMKVKGNPLEVKLNSLIEENLEKRKIHLHCECGEPRTCHGQTIVEYLVWELGRRGFKVNQK